MSSQGPVERGVRAELRKLGAKERSPALTAVALEAAQAVDRTAGTRDLASIMRELRAALADLRAIEPAKTEGSRADEVRARREARRRGAAAAGQ